MTDLFTSLTDMPYFIFTSICDMVGKFWRSMFEPPDLHEATNKQPPIQHTTTTEPPPTRSTPPTPANTPESLVSPNPHPTVSSPVESSTPTSVTTLAPPLQDSTRDSQTCVAHSEHTSPVRGVPGAPGVPGDPGVHYQPRSPEYELHSLDCLLDARLLLVLVSLFLLIVVFLNYRKNKKLFKGTRTTSTNTPSPAEFTRPPSSPHVWPEAAPDSPPMRLTFQQYLGHPDSGETHRKCAMNGQSPLLVFSQLAATGPIEANQVCEGNCCHRSSDESVTKVQPSAAEEEMGQGQITKAWTVASCGCRNSCQQVNQAPPKVLVNSATCTSPLYVESEPNQKEFPPCPEPQKSSSSELTGTPSDLNLSPEKKKSRKEHEMNVSARGGQRLESRHEIRESRHPAGKEARKRPLKRSYTSTSPTRRRPTEHSKVSSNSLSRDEASDSDPRSRRRKGAPHVKITLVKARRSVHTSPGLHLYGQHFGGGRDRRGSDASKTSKTCKRHSSSSGRSHCTPRSIHVFNHHVSSLRKGISPSREHSRTSAPGAHRHRQPDRSRASRYVHEDLSDCHLDHPISPSLKTASERKQSILKAHQSSPKTNKTKTSRENKLKTKKEPKSVKRCNKREKVSLTSLKQAKQTSALSVKRTRQPSIPGVKHNVSFDPSLNCASECPEIRVPHPVVHAPVAPERIPQSFIALRATVTPTMSSLSGHGAFRMYSLTQQISEADDSTFENTDTGRHNTRFLQEVISSFESQAAVSRAEISSGDPQPELNKNKNRQNSEVFSQTDGREMAAKNVYPYQPESADVNSRAGSYTPVSYINSCAADQAEIASGQFALVIDHQTQSSDQSVNSSEPPSTQTSCATVALRECEQKRNLESCKQQNDCSMSARNGLDAFGEKYSHRRHSPSEINTLSRRQTAGETVAEYIRQEEDQNRTGIKILSENKRLDVFKKLGPCAKYASGDSKQGYCIQLIIPNEEDYEGAICCITGRNPDEEFEELCVQEALAAKRREQVSPTTQGGPLSRRCSTGQGSKAIAPMFCGPSRPSNEAIPISKFTESIPAHRIKTINNRRSQEMPSQIQSQMSITTTKDRHLRSRYSKNSPHDCDVPLQNLERFLTSNLPTKKSSEHRCRHQPYSVDVYGDKRPVLRDQQLARPILKIKSYKGCKEGLCRHKGCIDLLKIDSSKEDSESISTLLSHCRLHLPKSTRQSDWSIDVCSVSQSSHTSMASNASSQEASITPDDVRDNPSVGRLYATQGNSATDRSQTHNIHSSKANSNVSYFYKEVYDAASRKKTLIEDQVRKKDSHLISVENMLNELTALMRANHKCLYACKSGSDKNYMDRSTISLRPEKRSREQRSPAEDRASFDIHGSSKKNDEASVESWVSSESPDDSKYCFKYYRPKKSKCLRHQPYTHWRYSSESSGTRSSSQYWIWNKNNCSPSRRGKYFLGPVVDKQVFQEDENFTQESISEETSGSGSLTTSEENSNSNMAACLEEVSSAVTGSQNLTSSFIGSADLTVTASMSKTSGETSLCAKDEPATGRNDFQLPEFTTSIPDEARYCDMERAGDGILNQEDGRLKEAHVANSADIVISANKQPEATQFMVPAENSDRHKSPVKKDTNPFAETKCRRSCIRRNTLSFYRGVADSRITWPKYNKVASDSEHYQPSQKADWLASDRIKSEEFKRRHTVHANKPWSADACQATPVIVAGSVSGHNAQNLGNQVSTAETELRQTHNCIQPASPAAVTNNTTLKNFRDLLVIKSSDPFSEMKMVTKMQTSKDSQLCTELVSCGNVGRQLVATVKKGADTTVKDVGLSTSPERIQSSSSRPLTCPRISFRVKATRLPYIGVGLRRPLRVVKHTRVSKLSCIKPTTARANDTSSFNSEQITQFKGLSHLAARNTKLPSPSEHARPVTRSDTTQTEQLLSSAHVGVQTSPLLLVPPRRSAYICKVKKYVINPRTVRHKSRTKGTRGSSRRGQQASSSTSAKSSSYRHSDSRMSDGVSSGPSRWVDSKIFGNREERLSGSHSSCENMEPSCASIENERDWTIKNVGFLSLQCPTKPRDLIGQCGSPEKNNPSKEMKEERKDAWNDISSTCGRGQDSPRENLTKFCQGEDRNHKDVKTKHTFEVKNVISDKPQKDISKVHRIETPFEPQETTTHGLEVGDLRFTSHMSFGQPGRGGFTVTPIPEREDTNIPPLSGAARWSSKPETSDSSEASFISSRLSELSKLCIIKPLWKNAKVEEIDRRVKRALKLREELKQRGACGEGMRRMLLSLLDEASDDRSDQNSESRMKDLSCCTKRRCPSVACSYQTSAVEADHTPIAQTASNDTLCVQTEDRHTGSGSASSQSLDNNRSDGSAAEETRSQILTASREKKQSFSGSHQPALFLAEINQRPLPMSDVENKDKSASNAGGTQGVPSSNSTFHEVVTRVGRSSVRPSPLPSSSSRSLCSGKRVGVLKSSANSPPTKISKTDNACSPRLADTLAELLPQVPLFTFVEWFIENSDPRLSLSSSSSSPDSQTEGNTQADTPGIFPEHSISWPTVVYDNQSNHSGPSKECKTPEEQVGVRMTWKPCSRDVLPVTESGMFFHNQITRHERRTGSGHDNSDFSSSSLVASTIVGVPSTPSTLNCHVSSVASAETFKPPTSENVSQDLFSTQSVLDPAVTSQVTRQSSFVLVKRSDLHKRQGTCLSDQSAVTTNSSSLEQELAEKFLCERHNASMNSSVFDINSQIVFPFNDIAELFSSSHLTRLPSEEFYEKTETLRNSGFFKEKVSRCQKRSFSTSSDSKSQKTTLTQEAAESVGSASSDCYQPRSANSDLLVQNDQHSEKIQAIPERLQTQPEPEIESLVQEDQEDDQDNRCAPGIRHIMMKLRQTSTEGDRAVLAAHPEKVKITVRKSSDVTGIIAKFNHEL